MLIFVTRNLSAEVKGTAYKKPLASNLQCSPVEVFVAEETELNQEEYEFLVERARLPNGLADLNTS